VAVLLRPPANQQTKATVGKAAGTVAATMSGKRGARF
jgi:hypothetical protein